MGLIAFNIYLSFISYYFDWFISPLHNASSGSFNLTMRIDFRQVASMWHLGAILHAIQLTSGRLLLVRFAYRERNDEEMKPS